MIRATNLTQVTEYYKNNTVSKQNSTEKTKDAQANAAKIKSSEDKLSSKAQKYLETDRKSTRLNSSHWNKSRMPSSA